MSRRALLGAAAVGLAAPGRGEAAPASGRKRPADPSISAASPLAHTTHGRLRGFSRRGVHVFRGVPYAGSPEGPHRFLRAPRLDRWDGVRPALNYGPICPQPLETEDGSQSEWGFLLQRGPATIQSEDCLRINIWTPGLADGGRRPIMLWLHPNGFMSGSGHHNLASDGENLVRNHDVVVASINHRVGVLGHSQLDHLAGARYADSGNAGMLDIIDALRWLGENAEAFGGDPGNITVFGESGGGSKTVVLLGMPEARGLFHKAITQSGFGLRVHSRRSGQALASAMVETLGAPVGDGVDALIAAPHAALVEASLAAWTSIRRINPAVPNDAYWQPVSGTPGLPGQPFDPVSPETARDIPMIVMTVRNESSPSIDAPELEAIGWEAAIARLTPLLGERAPMAMAAVRAASPGASPLECLSIVQGRSFRLAANDLCERRAAQAGAPTYGAHFSWKTPLFEGRPRAFHTSDIAFVFDNTDLCDQATGGGQEARDLAGRMSGAWVRFARTGDPNGQGLPHWPAFAPAGRATMVFDAHCATVADLDGPLLRILAGRAPADPSA